MSNINFETVTWEELFQKRKKNSIGIDINGKNRS